jgi:SAM-dependent methyltransferase
MSGAARGDLFDKSEEYEAMLDQGLRLSGEDRHYFIAGRLQALRELLGSFRPRSILDFGCGIGDTVVQLAAAFPDAEVTGVDAAEGAIEHARRVHTGPRVGFATLAEFEARGRYDLCYSNGVFHHIAPSERPRAAALVRDALAPGGRFALDFGQTAEGVYPRLEPRVEGEMAGFHFVEETRLDPMTSRIENVFEFSKNGRSERKLASQRVYMAGDVVRMLARAGLKTKELFGSIDGQPFGLSSQRLLLVAEKRDGA